MKLLQLQPSHPLHQQTKTPPNLAAGTPQKPGLRRLDHRTQAVICVHASDQIPKFQLENFNIGGQQVEVI